MRTNEPELLDRLGAYAEAVWVRHVRSLYPSSLRLVSAEIRDEMIERIRADAIEAHKKGKHLRAAVRRRDWWRTLDSLGEGGFGLQQFCFLEHAFPLMTAAERAQWLAYVWRRAKYVPSRARALSLFRAATELRRTVPRTWPSRVTLHRGTYAPTWIRARRRALNGVSWTTAPAVAEKFARDEVLGRIGYVVSGQVTRRQVLAYLEPDVVGEYEEQECIVDPSQVRELTFTQVGPFPVVTHGSPSESSETRSAVET